MDEVEDNRDIRRVNPLLPAPLANIIQKATDPDPARRHQTAKDLASDLEQFLLSHFMFPDEESVADYLASVFPQANKHRWW